MSDWSAIIDAVTADLITNVTWTTTPTLHKYNTQDPEELAASPGEAHLAMWPAQEQPETAVQLVTAPGGDQLTKAFVLLYWEHIGQEGGQQLSDEDAAKAMLDLHNAVRARFYQIANLQLGGTTSTRYTSTSFAPGPSDVRWFAMTIVCTSDIVSS